MDIIKRRRIDGEVPFDKGFCDPTGNHVNYHSTGYEVMFNDLPGDWWNEYEHPWDDEAPLEYGR